MVNGTIPVDGPTYIRVGQSGALSGTVRVSGAKNSALKLMAAALLAPGEFTIRGVPHIADVRWMGELLEQMGVGVSQEGGVLTLDVPEIVRPEAPY